VLDEAEILTIALAPEARGHGHAGALLSRHLDALSRRGVRQVHLEVEEGNVPAIALYRRHGFRETGRRTGYYRKTDGARASALTMALDL
jgi:ribosomal-protein-alanine N-acetyltransferase